MLLLISVPGIAVVDTAFPMFSFNIGCCCPRDCYRWRSRFVVVVVVGFCRDTLESFRILESRSRRASKSHSI
jgi:hypothetical protein